MNLATIESKAFVPAPDFELSTRFYLALGFEIPWSSDGLAFVRHGDTSFLLQAFDQPGFAQNFQMHLLVENVDDWHAQVLSSGVAERFGVEVGEPADRPWAMRDFTLLDPAGVLWRIAQNIPRHDATQDRVRHDPVPGLEIREATAADRPALLRMLELYQHDLSDIWDQDIDAAGEYGYALDRASVPRKAFLAWVDGRYAGFSLVDRESKVGQDTWWMDQFFILKKYRHRGIGEGLATSVFAALPGRWEVGQMPANRSAQMFWRRVIANYTGGNYTEHEVAGGWWTGVVQCFRAPA